MYEPLEIKPKQFKRGPYVTIVDNRITEIFIHQSLIKRLQYKGEKINQCWKKVWHTELLCDYNNPMTKSMTFGVFFETLCIGKSNSDPIYDLKRKRNGDKTIDQVRIEEQAYLFKNTLDKYGIILIPDGQGSYRNVQVSQKIKHEMEGYEDIDIYVEGVADIISPVSYGKYNYDTAVIDLKLTLNRESNYGYYCWGTPEYMDHIQAFIYSYIFKMPFLYWVFDYNSRDRGEKIIPINTNIEHKDRGKAMEARIRFKDMMQAIRSTAADILTYHTMGWPIVPKYERCKPCPIFNCEEREEIQEA